jgi:hypothetical protein
MQINIWGTLVIIAALSGSALYVQNLRIESLNNDLETMTKTAETQGEQIKSLQDDFKNLQAIDTDRKDRRLDNEVKGAKLRKDSKKSNVVAAKPRLVEKQINQSFESFAQDLQESTR